MLRQRQVDVADRVGGVGGQAEHRTATGDLRGVRVAVVVEQGVGDGAAREGFVGGRAALPQPCIGEHVRVLADQEFEALREPRLGDFACDFRADVVAGAALFEHAHAQREQREQAREQQQHERDQEHGARLTRTRNGVGAHGGLRGVQMPVPTERT